jgi:IS5 family transposase
VATGKVARRAAVCDIAALLDSPEVAALIAELDALRWTGRKGYGARALVGACLIKSLYGFVTWTRAASLIADHPGLQAALGGCPSLSACYRFTVKLRKHSDALADCLDRIAVSLQAELPGLGGDMAIDASDLAAFANGQRFVSQHGPERERYSDPDASWGHRSAVSTRKGGGFYGYKIQLAVCTRTGLPLAWQIESARHHESKFVAPLLDKVRARGYRPETCALDKGYDSDRCHAECVERGVNPVIPLKGERAAQIVMPIIEGATRFNPRIQRHTQRYRDLYRGRAAVEREFGRLKHDYGLAPLRNRGIERVGLHADLTMLARLAQALSRARAVPSRRPRRAVRYRHGRCASRPGSSGICAESRTTRL